MTSMNISMPDEMREWIEAEAKATQCNNSSEYLRHLVRREQEHKRKLEALREAVRHGRESGYSDKTFDEIVADARKKTLAEQ